MPDKVTSHRRVVTDETGRTTEVETAVLAENIQKSGDLPEVEQVDSDGVSLMVGVDGKLRRATLAQMLNWIQANVQADISFHLPYADAGTGNWMVYDPAAGSYQDSGVGAIGADGEQGPPGTPGRDGEDGAPGPAGTNGKDGKDGADGKDGMACRTARFVVGTSTTGWTADDCDYLCDGTDDQVEIQAAINALPASGGEIVILDGTYNISEGIMLRNIATKIQGCGYSTILDGKNIQEASGLLYNSSSVGAISVSSLKIIVNDSVKALIVGGSSRCEVFNTWIVGNGINIGISSFFRIHHNIIDGGNSTSAKTNSGIYTLQGYRGTITDNIIAEIGFGVLLNSNDNIIVANNQIIKCHIGVYLTRSDYSDARIVIENNICYENDVGILTGTDRSIISGNICIRGNGSTDDYTSDQHTIQVVGSYCLVTNNLVCGKACTITGSINTVNNNKDK